MLESSEASPQTDECELVILSERSERRISLHQLRNEMLRGVYPEPFVPGPKPSVLGPEDQGDQGRSQRAQHDMRNLVSFVRDLSYEDV